MFKDIGYLFDKKRSLISKDQDKNKQILDNLKIFLEQEFGQGIKGLSFIVNFNAKENFLTITTDNKALANELTMRLGNLIDFLKRRKITLSRILVR